MPKPTDFFPFMQRPPGKKKANRPLYDPAAIYEYIHSNTDKWGRVNYSIQDLAEPVGMERATLSRMISDYIEIGLMERKDRILVCLREPSTITWEPDLYDKITDLRSARHTKYSK